MIKKADVITYNTFLGVYILNKYLVICVFCLIV